MRSVLPGLLMLLAGSAGAQEGFPLDGTWRGETVVKDGSHRTIVLVMQWDGKQISGTMNPGPDSTDFTGRKTQSGRLEVHRGLQDRPGRQCAFLKASSPTSANTTGCWRGKWNEGTSSFDIRFVHE